MSLETALEELFETCPASRVLAQKMYDYIEELRTEGLKADCRACEAERVAARYREEALAQEVWFLKAKAQAGFGPNVSFDVVWRATLQQSMAAGGRPVDGVQPQC
jgi:hypothetical protein